MQQHFNTKQYASLTYYHKLKGKIKNNQSNTKHARAVMRRRVYFFMVPVLFHRPSRPLQAHLIHIRIPLLKAERLVERVGLRAGGLRGEVKVDGGEFGAGEVDDALQEGAANALAPIGLEDYDILDTRLAAGRRLIDAQGGAADNPLGIVLRDEDPRPRRGHRTLLHQRRYLQIGIQLPHKVQQISDLGIGQSA